MTVEIEASETTIPALLEQIEHGDEVKLLKNGRPFALLSPNHDGNALPARSPEQVARAQAAMDRINARSKALGLKFDFKEFKTDKEFGRR